MARAAANLSIALDKVGYEVYIVTVHKYISFEYAGTLINMGDFKSENNSFLNRLNRFLILKKKITSLNIDVFIDLRTRTSFVKEFMINAFFYKKKVVYTIHNASYYKYIMNSISKFDILIKRSYGLLTPSMGLTNELKDKLGIKNIQTIYNPINKAQILNNIPEELDVNQPFILAVGHMNNDLKGFDHLIEAYAKSNAKQNGKTLVILGSGTYLENYKKLAIKHKVEKDILFLGKVRNPFKYYAKAEFFILSSKYEGFGYVILEALICGCPVVSYDCLSGPSEMIEHKKNGLLVKNQDIDELSKAITLFIEDVELRNYCKSNTGKNIKKFSFENIGK